MSYRLLVWHASLREYPLTKNDRYKQTKAAPYSVNPFVIKSSICFLK